MKQEQRLLSKFNQDTEDMLEQGSFKKHTQKYVEVHLFLFSLLTGRMHKQRSTVVKEILATERSYSSSLLALLQVI